AALSERMDAILGSLAALAPWLAGRLEDELRVFSHDPRFGALMKALGRISTVQGLPAQYDAIDRLAWELLGDRAVGSSTQAIIARLRDSLEGARFRAAELTTKLKQAADISARLFHEMDFRPLLDGENMLMRIGYDADT